MQKSNTSFYAAIAVLLSLTSFLYAWKFLVPDYTKNQTELVKTTKEIDAAKLKLDSLQSAKTSLDQLGDTVNKLFVSIPGDKDSPNLITELEAIATKNKTYIPSISVTDGSTGGATAAAAAPAASSNAISVAFTVNGSFASLNQLIADLEKDLRFTNIKSATYSYDEKSKLNSLALQVEVYKRSASTPAGVEASADSSGALSSTEATK